MKKKDMKSALDKTSWTFEKISRLLASFSHKLNEKTYLLVPDLENRSPEHFYQYYGYTQSLEEMSCMKVLKDIFNNAARYLGFTVITSMREFKNDGEVFNLFGEELSYQEELHDVALAIPEVALPRTSSVDDYMKKPYFPVVFKDYTTDRGEDIYFIENAEQLKKIITVLELPESQKIRRKEDFIVQEYIGNFESVHSSVRVYVTCTGEEIASFFLVNQDETPQSNIKRDLYGVLFNPCEYLVDPASEHYLNSKNITSNVATGGKAIPLNSKLSMLSAEEKKMLIAHEFNIRPLSLPDSLASQAQQIAKHFGPKRGVVIGIDFIYSNQSKKWYYIEANSNPSASLFKMYYKLNELNSYDALAIMQLSALFGIVESKLKNEKEKVSKRSNNKK